MEQETFVTITHDECKSLLHYDLVAECYHDIFNHIRTKNAYNECFGKKEQEDVEKIVKLCTKWQLKTGAPDKCKMKFERFNLWRKLVTFISEFCTLNGKKNIDAVKIFTI